MNTYRIYKNEINQLFASLKKIDLSVIGQGLDEKGKTVFREVSSIQELILDDITPLQPAKSYLFPPTEKVFHYTKKDGKEPSIVASSITSGDKKQILFGLRACDLHAINYLKDFYTGHYPDVYFLEKLQNTILVGIACEYPSNACFCTSMDISPVSSEGADIYLTPHENFYFIEFLTEKGESIKSAFAECLKASEAADNQMKEAIERKTAGQLLETIDLKSVKGNIHKTYDKPFWKKYSDSCVACGGCTFDCPTCSCFDMRDVPLSTKDGYRYKAWDSCSFTSFSLHASGHNPRATKTERLRQRILHKYHYSVSQMQTWSCTGCGRCIRVCPVGINTRSILKDIKEALHE